MADERTAEAGFSAAGDQEPAADAAKPRQPWIWAAAILVFVVSFGMPYVLLTSGRTTSSESAQSSAATDQPPAPQVEFPPAPQVEFPPSTVQRTGHERENAPRPAISAETIFAEASPAVVRVEVRDRTFKLIGQGSGFLVSEDGLVATNHHVIQDAYFAHVTFSDGSKYPVEGVAASIRTTDLALLKIPGRQFPFLKMAEDALPSVGSKVYAIGTPHGLTNSLSDGLVSGHRQFDDDFTFIQTTAAISPGSSGGPLFSKDGRVLGVTTASIRGGQNLNLAVPVKVLKDAITRRGKLQTLASAGGKRLKADDAQRFDDVWVAINKKEFGQALRLLTQLRESQKDSSAYWFAVGFVQGELGNHEVAIDAWKQSLSIEPGDEVAYFNLGVTYQQLDRQREALAAYNSALALNPKYTSAQRNSGVAYTVLGEYAKAVASFKSVVAVEPDNAKAYASMGVAYMLSDQTEAAVRSLNTAVSLDPTDGNFYETLGVCLTLLHRHEEAIKACRSAVRINPNDASAYTSMGRCYSALRDNQEAKKALETAVKIKPDRADAHLFLGGCYLQDSISHSENGRRTESISSENKARAQFRRAVELDPNGQTGKTAQNVLNKISR